MGAWTKVTKKDTLDELIVALCKDFRRRERTINHINTSHRTKVELKYINYKLAEAAKEIVGDDFATYIYEIGESVGYAKTSLNDIGETAYKLKKSEVKANIAKRMHLSD